MSHPAAVPPPDCQLCERLYAFRAENKKKYPDWFNAPVPGFHGREIKLLVVGLAPGLKGANRTGRPFTGDYAGNLLYSTLCKFDFAEGVYQARPDDTLKLKDCSITNAVRCLPPQNKPIASEIRQCRQFLMAEIERSKSLKAILALGRIAHDTLIRNFDLKLADYRFKHGARHDLPSRITLFDSYHCSRYNTNTRRLSEEMFHDVFADIRSFVSS